MTQEEKQWIHQIGETIINQLFWSITPSVYFSWGVKRKVITSYHEMPTVALYTNGALHKGWVLISYNGGSDTYEIRLFGKDNETVIKLVEDVYCDVLGTMVDELVERPANISNDEYSALIAQSEAV